MFYIYEVKSKEDLDYFCNKTKVKVKYPKSYPCKIIFDHYESTDCNEIPIGDIEILEDDKKYPDLKGFEKDM